jgi:UDP:flavonoid glycosyltransferase YjiC (YdhE family)
VRALLVTTGSHGDINPFLALGRALAARGHQPVLMTNPYYEGQAREAGLDFRGVGEHFDLKRLDELMPDIMHPWKGGRVVVETLIDRFARESFPRVRDELRGGRFDVVVHHHIALGAAWAAEEAGVPNASAVLAPMMWMSRGDPITPQSFSPVHPGPITRWLTRAMFRPFAWMVFDPVTRRVRRDLGLRPDPGSFLRLARGGAVNLGLWSPALRGPLPDDPPHGVICGFPWHDRHGEQEGPDDRLEAFLAEGEAPVLFTLGTAAVHVAGDYFQMAAGACRRLGRRGLLLVGPGRPAPRNLPAGSLAVEYARFSSVMPRCAVNVHHGGVGSTGQGLRAGRPTVVIPHSHDQFDNAARLVRLGVSATLPRPRVTPDRLAAAVRGVLEDGGMAGRAAGLGRAMAGEDGAARAVEALERALRGVR